MLNRFYNFEKNEETKEERESLRLKYSATECVYRDDAYNEKVKNFINDMYYTKFHRVTNILENITNNNVASLYVIMNNNYILITPSYHLYRCVVLDGNYEFKYDDVICIKNIFATVIKNHNFLTNIQSLFEIIKNKIYVLKCVLINITDIYKYILQFITQIYLNDDDIILELFCNQNVIKYVTKKEDF